MNTITLFLSDGQVFRFETPGTIPQLQREFTIGKTLKDSGQSIEANTIE